MALGLFLSLKKINSLCFKIIVTYDSFIFFVPLPQKISLIYYPPITPSFPSDATNVLTQSIKINQFFSLIIIDWQCGTDRHFLSQFHSPSLLRSIRLSSIATLSLIHNSFIISLALSLSLHLVPKPQRDQTKIIIIFRAAPISCLCFSCALPRLLRQQNFKQDTN